MKSKLVQIGDKVLALKRVEPEPEQVELCNTLIAFEGEGADVPIEIKFSDSYKAIELMVLRLNVEVTATFKCLVYKLANDDVDVALVLLSTVPALALRHQVTTVTALLFLQNYQGHLPDPYELDAMIRSNRIMTVLSNPESWSV